MRPTVARTVHEVRSVVAAARSTSVGDGRVALVPTMGALHDGHLAHVARAREVADLVVVSIFVNPLQFAPGEDFDRYPRTFDADLDALERAGAHVVFVPGADEMYPSGRPTVRLTAGPAGNRFEGRSRAGHFDGMLTVVAKLLNIVAPDIVTFGQKDAQQAFLVGRMVDDLNIPVRVERIPTVREADGLALSSRNRYLSADERRSARAIPAALEAAASNADRGIDDVLAAAQSAVAGDEVRLDYLAVVHPDTFQPVDDGYRGAALVLIAARVGATRLIDNRLIHLG